MKSNTPLKAEKAVAGMKVWIDTHVADKFTEILSDIVRDNIEVPNGVWEITEVTLISESEQDQYRIKGLDDSLIPIVSIVISNDSWENSLRIKKFLISFNKDSNAIVSGARLFSGDILYPYCESIKEIIELNRNRRTCIACGEDLHIIMTNVRICRQCEGV